jgi:hypothetical protein
MVELGSENFLGNGDTACPGARSDPKTLHEGGARGKERAGAAKKNTAAVQSRTNCPASIWHPMRPMFSSPPSRPARGRIDRQTDFDFQHLEFFNKSRLFGASNPIHVTAAMEGGRGRGRGGGGFDKRAGSGRGGRGGAASRGSGRPLGAKAVQRHRDEKRHHLDVERAQERFEWDHEVSDNLSMQPPDRILREKTLFFFDPMRSVVRS